MNNEHVNTKTAKSLLGITVQTLRNWDKEGKIKTIRTPSNIRMYNKQDIQRIITGVEVNAQVQNTKQKICYCRVSSRKQLPDLERQQSFLKSKYPDYKLVSDVASGLNWNRKGFKTILEFAMRGDLEELVVAHRDRLARFSFELVQWILEFNKVKLVVLEQPDYKNDNTELADDLMSIIHVYSCRTMGKRRYASKANTNIPNVQTSETA